MSDKTGANETLTPRQLRALEVYSLTGNATAAAQAGDVSRKTFYAWIRLPKFAAELRRIDGDALANLGRRVMGLSEKTAKTLEDALAENRPMAIRLRAAALVLERGPALSELTQIVTRIEALERQLNDGRK